MYELPPILQGNEATQLRNLRDYLVRLSRDLDDNISKTISTTVESSLQKTSAAVKEAGTKNDLLRGLIIKTADEIHHEIDIITQELNEDYLAVSDFGEYTDKAKLAITQTARAIDEQYSLTSTLKYLDEQNQSAFESIYSINGEIRRGFIENPDYPDIDPDNPYVTGIAISEKLEFDTVEITENGITYTKLMPGQTFGLYTSKGWQFWMGGMKRGWFDSRDGMLHTIQFAVEQSIVIGGGWELTAVNGFGIKYTGSPV